MSDHSVFFGQHASLFFRCLSLGRLKFLPQPFHGAFHLKHELLGLFTVGFSSMDLGSALLHVFLDLLLDVVADLFCHFMTLPKEGQAQQHEHKRK